MTDSLLKTNRFKDSHLGGEHKGVSAFEEARLTLYLSLSEVFIFLKRRRTVKKR